MFPPTSVLLIVVLVVQFSNGDTKELFSPKEKEALNQFRAKLSIVPIQLPNSQNTDDYLITWLQARNLNVEAAYEMLIENLKWRRKYKINSIFNETILQFNPSPVLLEGYDKEGYPLVFFAATNIDDRKLILQGHRNKVIRYWYQVLEIAAERARNSPPLTNGHNVTKSSAIIDMHGFNLRQHFCVECASVYRELFIGLTKYYPDDIRHFILLNVPRIAKPMVEFIRPLLSPNYTKALKIFSVDKKEYSKFLLKIIDADQLPYQFGGTKKISSLG